MRVALFHVDILDLFALLRKHRVRYLVVGGEAVIQYGYARFTADMDIFFDAGTANAARLYDVLQEFWGGTVDGIENASVLQQKGKVFPLPGRAARRNGSRTGRNPCPCISSD